MAFTPGPWQYVDLTVYALEFSHYRAGREIMRNRFDCWIQGPRSTPLEEKEANARLIAKAPEMYDVLSAFSKSATSDNWYSFFLTATELLKKIDGD